MATILNNRAFPDSRADLSRSAAQGLVIGYVTPGNILNQQWTFTPVAAQQGYTNIKSLAADGVIVGVDAAEVPENAPDGHVYRAAVYGGGSVKNFVIKIINGGVLICLPGVVGRRSDLYWTLVDDLLSTPIRLMALRDGQDLKTQIWDLDHAD